MKNGITLLDGAVGTSLWELAERNGIKKDPVWTYNLTHPELVTELARQYAEAGAQIMLANTFGANEPVVKRASSFDADVVVRTGVQLEKQAVAGTGIKVALSIGPLSQLMEPYGDLTEEEVEAIYLKQIDAGMQAGADCIMIQTFIDLSTMAVAARVAKRYEVPVYCTMSFEARGKTMMGNSVQDIIDTLTPLGVDAVGMNCSLGPDKAIPIIKEFSEKTDLPLVFKPNAGLPIMSANGTTASVYDADTFVKDVTPAIEYVSYIGGCCGSNASYVRALKKLLDA